MTVFCFDLWNGISSPTRTDQASTVPSMGQSHVPKRISGRAPGVEG